MMSLSKWERQALGSIEDGLTGSDPPLASLLGNFSRLALGEEMPVREKIRALRRRVARRSSTGRDPGQDTVLVQARLMYLRLGPQRAAFLLWLVISAGLIVAVLALSTGGDQVTCAPFMRVACGG
ncbi:MAG: hypothetical protein ACRDND_09550 [Streptosporangiaceae bacterium]